MSQVKNKLLGLFRKSTVSEGSEERVEQKVRAEGLLSCHELTCIRIQTRRENGRESDAESVIEIETGTATNIPTETRIETEAVNAGIAKTNTSSASDIRQISVGPVGLASMAPILPKRGQNPGDHLAQGLCQLQVHSQSLQNGHLEDMGGTKVFLKERRWS